MSSFIYHGTELVQTGLVPNFWRGPTDNDNWNKMPEWAASWRRDSRERNVTSVSVERLAENRVAIAATFELDRDIIDFQSSLRHLRKRNRSRSNDLRAWMRTACPTFLGWE